MGKEEMKQYAVNISMHAERDISGALDYIEFTIKNPTAGDELFYAVKEAIGSLECNPKRFPIVDEEILAALGIRVLCVKNYLAFYIVNDEKESITVVRFCHHRSNWKNILKVEI